MYIFQGKYSGKAEYEYKNPEVGAVHKCLIFISQESEHEQYEFAETEIMKYGFCEIENMKGNLLPVSYTHLTAFLKKNIKMHTHVSNQRHVFIVEKFQKEWITKITKKLI